jgi:hypothetical protein
MPIEPLTTTFWNNCGKVIYNNWNNGFHPPISFWIIYVKLNILIGKEDKAELQAAFPESWQEREVGNPSELVVFDTANEKSGGQPNTRYLHPSQLMT